MLILTLAWRNLWRNRRRTTITLSSIGIGLALVVWTDTIVAGSHNTMINKATRLMAGHVTVEKAGYRESPGPDLFVPSVEEILHAGLAIPGVLHPKVLIFSQGVASSSNGSVAINLMGLQAELEAAESPLARSLVAGRYLEAGDDRGVFLGKSLADRLMLDVGKKIVVTTTDTRGELSTDLLRVVGIFRTGADEMDTGLVQVTLTAARRVLHMGSDEATQVGFLLRSPDLEQGAIEVLRSRLTSRELEVLPWETVMPELANWVHLFRVLSQGMVWLMLVLVSFNILNTILMSVLERKREFATLLALGVSPALLRLQVFVETALLGLLGATVGAALGGAVSWWGSRHGLDLGAFLADGLAIAGFPFDMMVYNEISASGLLRLAGAVFAGTLIIGAYPTYRSARVPIADSLRLR